MTRVGEVVPILPVALTATALLATAPDTQTLGLSGFELKGRVQTLMDALERRGGHVHIPRLDREYAVEVGLRMLRLRRMVLEKDGLLRPNPAELVLLRYYANSIAHLVRPADTPMTAPHATPDGNPRLAVAGPTAAAPIAPSLVPATDRG